MPKSSDFLQEYTPQDTNSEPCELLCNTVNRDHMWVIDILKAKDANIKVGWLIL